MNPSFLPSSVFGRMYWSIWENGISPLYNRGNTPYSMGAGHLSFTLDYPYILIEHWDKK